MQQGGKPASLYQIRHQLWLYPCLITEASGLGYLLFRVRPFNSEVHSASALLPCFHRLLPGSLKTALKRTRPRQRFWILLVAIL